MKKRAVSLLLAIFAAVTVIAPAFAASEPAFAVSDPVFAASEPAAEEGARKCTVYVNGFPMDTDEYVLIDGTNYLTVRAFMAALDSEAVVEERNGTVTVSAETSTVVDTDSGAASVVTDTLTLTAKTDAKYIEANGRCLYVEGGTRMVNGAVAVPVRVLAVVYNLGVDYDEYTGVATLYRQEGRPAYLESGDTYYDADDLLLLAKIIYSESGNQSLTGKIAVGNVVMNRVRSSAFPNTIYGVLTQKNQFASFRKRSPTKECYVAAKLVLEGAVVVGNATFFNRAGMKNTYACKHKTYVTTIGAHDFYA